MGDKYRKSLCEIVDQETGKARKVYTREELRKPPSPEEKADAIVKYDVELGCYVAFAPDNSCMGYGKDWAEAAISLSRAEKASFERNKPGVA